MWVAPQGVSSLAGIALASLTSVYPGRTGGISLPGVGPDPGVGGHPAGAFAAAKRGSGPISFLPHASCLGGGRDVATTLRW
jgi:hypothetical protein